RGDCVTLALALVCGRIQYLNAPLGCLRGKNAPQRQPNGGGARRLTDLDRSAASVSPDLPAPAQRRGIAAPALRPVDPPVSVAGRDGKAGARRTSGYRGTVGAKR